MEFQSNRTNRLLKAREGSVDDQLISQYLYCIDFYTVPPFGKIALEDAEDMVSERLNLLQICDEMLKTLENSSTFKRSKQYFETLESRLQSADSKFDKNFYLASKANSRKKEVIDARRRDRISHFLLRIYYCRSDELKKWFISRECELLRARLMDNSIIPDLPQILSYNGFNFESVSDEERLRLFDKINWNNSLRQSANTVVYRIRFEESLEAVKNRKVYLNSGFAYIMVQDMVSVICGKFRSDLSHSLALMQLSLHQLEEDERLIPRLHSLHLHHIQNRKSALNTEDDSGREVVTPGMIDGLSKESFPACMRNINEWFRKEHHLRHYGRLYYGLFLRSIGLSLDDALNFFREEFIKKITPEKFQKEYSYNIRYNYGREGKKVVGKAFGCQKIISDNPPGPADAHGCPFKHFDQNNLKQMLRKHEINENVSKEILEIIEKEQNYSKACSKYFSSKHYWYPEVTIYHPNQYYSESRKALQASILTPPVSGQQLVEDNPNDMSLTADTTVDALEESLFETEDEFERSVAAMDLDVSASAPVVSADEPICADTCVISVDVPQE